MKNLNEKTFDLLESTGLNWTVSKQQLFTGNGTPTATAIDKNKERYKMTKLNAYTIAWAIISPIEGKTTKADLKIMKKCGLFHSTPFLRNNEISLHFATKEIAIDRISNVIGLSRKYKVVLITDKQFGLSKYNETLLKVATKKQLIDMKFI